MAMRLIISIIMALSISLPAAPQVRSGNAIKAAWYKDRLGDEAVTLSEKLGYTDSLISLSRGNDRFPLYKLKADFLYDMGRYTEALRICDSVAPRVPDDSLNLRFSLEWMRGMLAFTQRDYSQAIEIAYRMLHTPKPESMAYHDVKAYTILTDFYGLMGNIPLSWRYNRKGFDLLLKVTPTAAFPASEKARLISVFRHANAGLYLEEMKLDSAYMEIMASVKERGSSDYDSMVEHVILGNIMRRQGNPDIAGDMFLQSLRKKDIDNFNRTFALLNYAEMLVERGDADGALKTLSEYGDVAAKIKGSPLEPRLLRIHADCHELKGDYREAARLLNEIIQLNDSLESDTRIALTDEIAKRYENMDAEDKARRSAIDGSRKAVVISALVLLAMILVGLLVFFLMRRRNDRRRFRSMESRLDEAEKMHREEVRDSEASLEGRSRELSAMTMLMGRLNEALNKIQMASDDVRLTPEERLETVRTTIRTLEREENVWEMFRLYFEKVNQSFFDRLYRLCPSLTNAEIRMCAFILINLTTKETAILTNRSARTVETIKHNLRKKLGVTGPSETFMRHVASASEEEFQKMVEEAGSARMGQNG